ncbi:MAG: S8 family peptidase [Acidimicrobiales bacterium]
MAIASPTSNCRSVEWKRAKTVGVAAMLCCGVLGVARAADSAGLTRNLTRGAALSYIVQGANSRAAAAGVVAEHGSVGAYLPIVHGVVAKLTSGEVAAARQEGLQVTPNAKVSVEGSSLQSMASSPVPPGLFAAVTGASTLWAEGINGAGVTVAVLDTGIQASIPDFDSRVIGGVNIADPAAKKAWKTDTYGHGTFVAGVIAADGTSSGGEYTGVAPGADLVSIKVANGSGQTTEAMVIAGVAWAVNNENNYGGIGVLNMSLGVVPSDPTALDPLDQAVEQAWESGIVVVTSAGNSGPDNGTITAPGDDPLAITVGSMDDSGAINPSGFTMSAFSSVGPTDIDGWFKPDLVAPGQSIVSVMPVGSTIWKQNPKARIGTDNFLGAGTSFSAAIVSGLAALLLEEDPNLTPDQVKAALLFSADPGPVGDPLVDGHGVADVAEAASVAGQVFLDQSGAAAAESNSPPATVSLASTWAVSTWNPANWSGPAWAASQLSSAGSNAPASNPVNGTDWDGTTWNGAAWNGAAWNGAAWNGAAWNSAAFTGAAWNGAAWNGAAWNAAAWSGAAWNGAAWNGTAWNEQSWG